MHDYTEVGGNIEYCARIKYMMEWPKDGCFGLNQKLGRVHNIEQLGDMKLDK